MQQRRLAAIMFTDIVGYTSLMGSNEKQAFDTLKKNRRIHYRLIKKYGGRLLKEMGDGILASFPSDLDAVVCALTIQQATDDLKIPLRVGIHQGDVIFEKKDVLGDGVNIASRIQNVADTNGIVISETVYNDIRNKEGLEFKSLGRKSLKGVGGEIDVYEVSCPDKRLLDLSVDTGELIRPLGIGRVAPVIGGLIVIALLAGMYFILPRFENNAAISANSMMILPLANYTGSDQLEYMAAGVHDGLITEIGKISALRVVSKTTSNAYKNVQKSIPEIAKERSVGTVVEGSLKCYGDSICLQVKLVSAYPEEQQIWAKDYVEDRREILNLYSQIAKDISKEINVSLTPEEEGLLAASSQIDPEAYEAFVRGQYHWERLSEDDLMIAKDYFEKAIRIEPDWAPPYGGMSKVWKVLGSFDFMPDSITEPRGAEFLRKSLELEPNSAYAHYLKALEAVWPGWDWKLGEDEFLTSLKLNPNDALCRVYYAHLLIILRRYDDALEQVNLSLQIDPLRPLVLGLAGVVLADMGENDRAMEVGHKALEIDPGNNFAYSALHSAHYNLGNYDEVFEMWKKSAIWNEEEAAVIQKIFDKEGYFAAVSAAIKVNEEVYAKDGRMSNLGQAGRYYQLKEYERALDYLERAYEEKNWELAYMNTNEYRNLRGHPRYEALRKKMNFPEQE